MDVKPAHLLMRALRGEQVERTPVWAMRQAGRWDPEFRKLREGRGFYEFSESAELSAKASLCPRRFGVDAIILFYDITTLAIAMGQSFDLVPSKGPVPRDPVLTASDVQRLSADPHESRYESVLEILRLVRKELAGSLPILVFAGAPFTMATYQTGIGRDGDAVARFRNESPRVWDELVEKTARATVRFLKTLLREGADAYQLFDSWAGTLSEEEYRQQAQPFHEAIFREVAGPSILFVKDLPYVDLAVQSGATAISLGKGHDLAALKNRYPDTIFQGNVDHELLIHGMKEQVRDATKRCLEAGGGHRHILNLDHGMDPHAKVENFEAFVDTCLKT